MKLSTQIKVKNYLRNNYLKLTSKAKLSGTLRSAILSDEPKALAYKNIMEDQMIEMIAIREELEAIFEALNYMPQELALLLIDADMENDSRPYDLSKVYDDLDFEKSWSKRTVDRRLEEARNMFADLFTYKNLKEEIN